MKNLILTFGIALITQNISASVGIQWQNMSTEVFKRAKSENKLVLLNLEANWCHWCHVMHNITYSNPDVIKYVNSKYIAVQADQDANPELSIRYRDYGWPATVILNPDGDDLVKRAGYIKPSNFMRLLKSTDKKRTPEEPYMSLSHLSLEDHPYKMLFEKLEQNFFASLDLKVGGFMQNQKYVEWDTYEFAMFFSKDPRAKLWIEKSVAGAKQLSDPVWGGVYQYSTHNDWKHLHFEKLLSIQARYIKIFVYHYLYSGNTESLDYAKNIVAYCKRFLMHPNGLFSNAQDADLIKGKHAENYFAMNDSERLKQGIPKIDESTFTNNNAEFSNALMVLYAATNCIDYHNLSAKILIELADRTNSIGLFYHTQNSENVISLRDNIAMAEALVQYLKLDPENERFNKYLKELINSINDGFTLKNGSFKSFIGENGLHSEPIISENIKMARILNWYSYYSGEDQYTDRANKIHAFLNNKKVAVQYTTVPALMTLTIELQSEPNQFVFLELDKRENLLNTAFAFAPFFSLFSKYSRKTLPKNKSELFENFNENVLLSCTSNTCSSPLYSPESIANYFGKQVK